jgi:hypothetical protein
MIVVARRLALGVPFGDGLNLTAETMAAIPPDKIGRMMSGAEATELILRQAMQAKVLTKDEERRIAIRVARLRDDLLGKRNGNG